MGVDNELHARALRMFGRGYLSPHRTDEVLSITFERIDSAETRANAAEKRIAELEEEATAFTGYVIDRSEAGPQVNPITSEVQDGRWVNAIVKSRWNGEAWDSIGMVNGWIGSFEGELPDCVADKCRGIDYGHIPEATQ